MSTWIAYAFLNYISFELNNMSKNIGLRIGCRSNSLQDANVMYSHFSVTRLQYINFNKVRVYVSIYINACS